MKDYKTLLILKETLVKSDDLINDILSFDREVFAKKDVLITMATGMVNELREIISLLNEDAYILSKELFDLVSPFKEQSVTSLTKYGVVNAYKLYDFIKIDLLKLKSFLLDIVN